jgi:hypothetical protein
MNLSKDPLYVLHQVRNAAASRLKTKRIEARLLASALNS